MTRTIHPIAEVFPPLTEKEYADLKNSIAEIGLTNPIVLHPDGSILDGRHRYQVCNELGIVPNYETWDGNGSLVSFVIAKNRLHRQLTSGQWAVVGSDLEPFVAEENRAKQIAAGAAGAAGARFGKLGGRGNKKKEDEENPLGELIPQGGSEKKRGPKSTEQVAAIVGTNGRYIADVKMLKTEAPDLVDKVATGEITLPQAKKEEKKRKAEEKVQKVIAQYTGPVKWSGELTPNSISVSSIHDLKLPPESIDMVFTDPPYHDEFVTLYDGLGRCAAEALKPGGYLLCYAGKMFLPDVIGLMSKHLEYVSVFCVFQSFSKARIQKHFIFENWRPILAFKKPGKTATKEWVQDVVRGKRDKSHHEWQQDTQAPAQYIAAYTKPGDLVLDPFVGGGTTPWVCKELGRNFVCFDVELSAVAISTERVTID